VQGRNARLILDRARDRSLKLISGIAGQHIAARRDQPDDGNLASRCWSCALLVHGCWPGRACSARKSAIDVRSSSRLKAKCQVFRFPSREGMPAGGSGVMPSNVASKMASRFTSL